MAAVPLFMTLSLGWRHRSEALGLRLPTPGLVRQLPRDLVDGAGGAGGWLGFMPIRTSRRQPAVIPATAVLEGELLAGLAIMFPFRTTLGLKVSRGINAPQGLAPDLAGRRRSAPRQQMAGVSWATSHGALL
jgi:hypothetical protein